MKTYTIKELEFIYTNAKQPKNAIYSNNVIFKMLKNAPKNLIIESEPTRGSNVPNRGSVVEQLVQAIILGNSAPTQKAQAGESDLDTTILSNDILNRYDLPRTRNLEIKFATSFSKGSPKHNRATYVLLINQAGAYLVPSVCLDRDNSGHIKPTSAKYGQHLKVLSQALGF